MPNCIDNKKTNLVADKRLPRSLMSFLVLAALWVMPPPLSLAQSKTVMEIAGLQYEFVELGTLDGQPCSYTHVRDVNSSGVATGGASPSGESWWILRGFRSLDGSIADLGDLGGWHALGERINQSGQIAGYAWRPADHPLGVMAAVIFHPNGLIQDLGLLDPNVPLENRANEATDINDYGQVVGYSTVKTLEPNPRLLHRAFYWDAETGMRELSAIGDVVGGFNTNAMAINNSGLVAGYYSTTPSICEPFRPFIWDKVNGMRELTMVPGHDYGFVYNINEAGHVVGFSFRRYETYWMPVRYIDGKGETLPLLNVGQRNGSAYGINNLGEIVGTIELAPYAVHAVLWRDNAVIDLDVLYKQSCGEHCTFQYLTRAESITDNGIIAGTGVRVGCDIYKQAAFLLRPVRPQSLGDLNCDGAVNFDDIDALQRALAGLSQYYRVHRLCNHLNGDFSGDGVVTFDDVDAFVGYLNSQPKAANIKENAPQPHRGSYNKRIKSLGKDSKTKFSTSKIRKLKRALKKKATSY